MFESLRYHFVKRIYGDHNSARAIRKALERVIVSLPADGTGLNVGAGRDRIDPRIRNMEIEAGEGIDIVGSVTDIPLGEDSVDLIITQEVLEHVGDPFLAARELHRVLKRGGIAYIQLPFTIGFHPCPYDFWRFSDQGIRQLVAQAGFEQIEIGMAVGPAVGFYRIAVEFVATLLSLPWSRLYLPAKLGAALLLFPVKWLDPLLRHSAQANRIAGGYFVICKKP